MAAVATAVAALGSALGTAPAAAAPGGGGKPRRVLFFTKSSGYEHQVIKEADGQPSFAGKILKELGAKNGFEVTTSKDGGLFTAEGLGKFDVLVFFTTGDLTDAGKDKNPPFPPGGKELLLETVKKGKGFVGLHSAADTFLSGPDSFKADGEKTDPYLKMVGGEFIKHGPQQTARLMCADAKFPGLKECKAPIDLMEEWYSFKNLAPDLHVLQFVATWSMKNTGKDSVYRRPPYPVTWARMHGKGRVFHTSLGHREDVWQSPMFQNLVVGAIRWAGGEVNADVKPNIAQVTPGYAELPPEDPAPPAPATAVAPAAPAAPAKPGAPAAPAKPPAPAAPAMPASPAASAKPAAPARTN
jgi:type 1 glutamine amidotransferase